MLVKEVVTPMRKQGALNLTVDPKTIERIDKVRGLYPRSRVVEAVVKRAFKMPLSLEEAAMLNTLKVQA
jgi:hypothetical protein